MASIAQPHTNPGPVRANWILNRKDDLIWYIGSALAGYVYIVLIWALANQVPGDDPVKGVITTLKLGGIHIEVTLNLLVVLSWAYLVDAPHIFATLARTFFDPDEREIRKTELRRSWLWFGFGPVFIVAPYLIGAFLPEGRKLSEFWLNFGWLIYFVFFRLWAYYHVVRQHWGFFSLYKRKNDDFADNLGNRIDVWFFNLILYLPLIMFMTSTYYAETPGFPDLGLRTPLFGIFSLGNILYPLAWAAYLLALIGYIGWQVYRWQEGAPLNIPKLLLMAFLIPLHLLAFSNPLFVLFLVPLVTVGHNLQYHRIVWSYGQSKYSKEDRHGFAWAKRAFSSFWVYALMGILFTFALYKGPWIEFIKATTGITLDKSLLNSLSMMAGVMDPSELNLGEKVFAAFLTGWAMQHYYLDSKIWRVRKDKLVQKNLQV